MREIKFRAFDPKKGMIEPYSVRTGRAWIIKPCRKDSPEVRVDGVNYYCNWDIDTPTEFPLMQYTGLKDVNGVEIYESDVVYCAGHGYCMVEISPIYGVILRDSNGFENPYIDCVAELDYPIVAGNIFQNPEYFKCAT